MSGLLVLVFGNSQGTFVTVLVGLAYSPVNCNSVNIAILDPTLQILQLKVHLTVLACLLLKISLLLLDR